MNYNNIKGSVILIAAAFIWGLAFVAQSGAAELVPSFTFNALRSVIGAAVLYAVYLIMPKKDGRTFFPEDKDQKKIYFRAGIICGTCLAVSVNFQQFGIAVYPEGAASEARAGFITALYVIIVPVISFFFGKRVRTAVWLGVIIAVIGVYMLCFSGGIDGVYFGDILILLCALSFSLHIICVDKYVAVTGGVKLSIMQFAVCSVVSGALALIFERNVVDWGNLLSAWGQILYLGIMSSGVAYTLQIVGQKYAEPTVAPISMSLESVFAALGGWIISGNVLSSRELLGCLLVFAAIIIAQLPGISRRVGT